MPKPAYHDFDFYEGDTEEIKLNLKDAAGEPIPVNNMDARIHIKENKFSTITVLEKTGLMGDGEIGAVGEIVFQFTSADTLVLNLQKDKSAFVYDIELDDSGSIKTLLTGNLIIWKGVSL